MILSPYQKPPIGTPLNRNHRFAKGLAGLWLMNEMSGDRIWDYSGNGNHGTCMNMSPQSPTSGWGPGPHGGAVAFDGGNDYVDCGNGPSLNITNQITLEVSLLFVPSAGWPSLLGKPHTANVQPYWMYVLQTPGTQVTFGIGIGGSITTLSTGALVTGAQYHIIATYNGAKMTIYINGIQSGASLSQTGLIDTNTANAIIGCFLTNNSDYIKSTMNFGRIYNRALSDLEVAILYARPYCMFGGEGLPAWMVPNNIPVFMNHYRQMMAA